MPDDMKLNLNDDAGKLSREVLDHVEAAAAEVKQQIAAAAEAERKQAEKARSKRLSAILIGVGALLVLLLSYWMVFAKPDSNRAATNKPRLPAGATVRIAQPCPGPNPNPTAQSTPTASGRQGRDSQVVEHPPDEFEQPNSGSGM